MTQQVQTGVGVKMTGDELSAPEFNLVNAAINQNSVDAQGKLINQVAINTLDDLSIFLVGSTYELTEGTYYFNNPIDFGTADILLIDANGCYDIRSNCIATLTYTGTTPFITSGAAGQLVTFSPYRVTATTALVFDGDGFAGDSFISGFGIFISCKEMVRLTGWSFFTVDAFAGVGCEKGVTLNNVTNINLSKPQWDQGLNLSGVAYTLLGSSSGRLICEASNSQPESTESFFDIQATWGGEASITTGVHKTGGGAFFKSGSKDETDPDIFVEAVKNVPMSLTFADGFLTGNSTETVIAVSGTAVKINATWTDVSKQRFSFSSGTWTYTGTEPTTVNASVITTIEPSGGGTKTISLYIAKNGVIVTTTKGESLTSTGTQVGAVGKVDLVTGDTLEGWVANDSDTNNLTITTASFNIN